MSAGPLTTAFMLLALCLLFVGCRGKALEPTYPVHGVVTLDQKPLANGTIVFLTAETGDLQAIAVTDGKYAGEARAGVRRVEIRAYLTSTAPRNPLDPPPANYILAKYNAESTLTANVTPTGANTFDFELESK